MRQFLKVDEILAASERVCSCRLSFPRFHVLPQQARPLEELQAAKLSPCPSRQWAQIP